MLHQRGDDLVGARRFSGRVGRRALRGPAHEDLATACRIAGAMSVERPFDRDLADVRIELKSGNLARRVHRPLKRLVQLGARQVVGREERHTDRVQPGLDRGARGRPPVAGRVLDLLIPVEELHALAVDRDLELFAGDLTQDGRKVSGDTFHRECVVTVGGKLILDQDAAAGSERQPFDVEVLRRVSRHIEHRLRCSRDITNREPADFSRGRQVRLHQRRRHRQRARLVVEAMRRIVGRQELRGIHFEREEVANRIRVFRPVEAMKARGRHVSDGAAIELILHPSNQRLQRRRIGTPHA